MSLSATSQVVVPSGLYSGKVSAFFHVFYDAADDEGKALGIMRKRTVGVLSAPDIRKHFKLHQQALERFYDIEEAVNVHNRRKVGSFTDNLVHYVLEYAALVSFHKEKLRNAFLHYPTCVRGNIFSVPWKNVALEKSFNPGQSFEGVKKDLVSITELVPLFREEEGEIPFISFSEGQDTGEGILDNSFRGRLELNRKLLKRVGFEV